MKKISYISFIFLAFVFTFKSLSFVVLPSKVAANYDVNINENESNENSEKEDVKMKDVFEEGKLSDSSDILIINDFTGHSFHRSSENRYFPPYFEVSSPPPELA